MPTNTQSHRSPRTVSEDKKHIRGSREFHETDDGMTVEVVHAEKILREHFEKLGYDEWLFGSVCSRKLLDKVKNRQPEQLTGPGFLRGDQIPQPVRRQGVTPITLEDVAERHFRQVAMARRQAEAMSDYERDLRRQQPLQAAVMENQPSLAEDMERSLIERRIRQESINEGLTQRQDQPDETPF